MSLTKTFNTYNTSWATNLLNIKHLDKQYLQINATKYYSYINN